MLHPLEILVYTFAITIIVFTAIVAVWSLCWVWVLLHSKRDGNTLPPKVLMWNLRVIRNSEVQSNSGGNQTQNVAGNAVEIAQAQLYGRNSNNPAIRLSSRNPCYGGVVNDGVDLSPEVVEITSGSDSARVNIMWNPSAKASWVKGQISDTEQPPSYSECVGVVSANGDKRCSCAREPDVEQV